MDEGRRTDSGRGSRGIRVPSGHQGDGADWRGLHCARSHRSCTHCSISPLRYSCCSDFSSSGGPSSPLRFSARSALLRPASAGFRRLANAVVAALFNIVIFGTGAAIYLYAVDLIMNTAIPAWLAAGDSGLAVRGRRLAASAAVPPHHPARREGLRRPLLAGGTWHRRFFRDVARDRPGGGGAAERGCARPPLIVRRSAWRSGRSYRPVGGGLSRRPPPDIPGHGNHPASVRPVRRDVD